MSLADDLPDCPECLRLMVEALAKSAADPENLALPPEEAEKATQHLRELLGRPERQPGRVGQTPRHQGQGKSRDLRPIGTAYRVCTVKCTAQPSTP